MKRLIIFVGLVLALTVLLFVSWFLSAAALPEEVLRGYMTTVFSLEVGQLTFWRVSLVNFLIPFLGIQFMNLFKVGKYPGGLYVLPVFWILYGVLLGTNSFVFAEGRVPLSLSVLWERPGFLELLAYTLGYEASRDWALWEQQGLWKVRRLAKVWRPKAEDIACWMAALLLLLLAAAREVR